MADLATSRSIVDRMLRAARLEVSLYEEVEADITATNQALLVVVFAALASGIGRAVGAGMAGPYGGSLGGNLIFGVCAGLIGWAVWSYVVYFVGTRFMGGTATYGELLRTLGFAETPSLLLIFSFIPVLGGVISIVAIIWRIVAGFIAIRQALDIDNTKTVFTIAIGIVALLIVIGIIGTIIGAIFGAGFMIGRML